MVAGAFLTALRLFLLYSRMWAVDRRPPLAGDVQSRPRHRRRCRPHPLPGKGKRQSKGPRGDRPPQDHIGGHTGACAFGIAPASRGGQRPRCSRGRGRAGVLWGRLVQTARGRGGCGGNLRAARAPLAGKATRTSSARGSEDWRLCGAAVHMTAATAGKCLPRYAQDIPDRPAMGSPTCGVHVGRHPDPGHHLRPARLARQESLSVIAGGGRRKRQ